MNEYIKTLDTFTLENIPDLDVAVLGALSMFSHQSVPELDLSHLKRPLVLGSVNAFRTAQIIFSDVEATFADESSFTAALVHPEKFDGVVVVSASGSKHAVAMVARAKEAGLDTYLITNTADSQASALLDDEHVFVFPKNREPYTYNTSTYLGPILVQANEDSEALLNFLEEEVSAKLQSNFADYTAFTLIIPAIFVHARGMLQTKFDELFGPMITGRVFTEEEIKHAKTVVSSDKELFIGFGVENNYYGQPENRLSVPIPKAAGYGAIIAIAYFIIGRIQAAHKPYFKQSIERYCREASEIFGQNIKPIVE